MENKPTIREGFIESAHTVMPISREEAGKFADHWLNKIKEVVGNEEEMTHENNDENLIKYTINQERQRILKEFGIIK